MYVKIEIPSDVVKRVLKAPKDNRAQFVAKWLQSQCGAEVEILAAITEHDNNKQRKKHLKSLGFDLSTKSRAKCSQCEAMAVNGTPIHESGCPNEKHECRGCGALIGPGQNYCKDCA